MQQWNRLEYPFSYLFLKNLSLFKKFTNNKISRQRIRSTRDEVDPIAAIPRFERIETSEEYAPLHICLINISRICRTNENRFVYPRPRKQGAACWNITGIRSRGRITPLPVTRFIKRIPFEDLPCTRVFLPRIRFSLVTRTQMRPRAHR